MPATVKFVVEVEDVDDLAFCITEKEAKYLLVRMVSPLKKENFSVKDAYWVRRRHLQALAEGGSDGG